MCFEDQMTMIQNAEVAFPESGQCNHTEKAANVPGQTSREGKIA